MYIYYTGKIGFQGLEKKEPLHFLIIRGRGSVKVLLIEP